LGLRLIKPNVEESHKSNSLHTLRKAFIMSNQQQLEQVSSWKRRGRGCLIWLSASVAILLGLMLLGAVYESVAERADARAYPAPGELVDVGGYRLHLYCVGTGSPTVVIDAGWGDWSGGWSRVQPEAAKTTRVCTYDRAGMGYSEAGPLPRTAEHFARELHVLLQRAGVQGPYVLVGHSLGGAPVRVFAHTYAPDVVGVVLIDSMNPGEVGTPAPATTATPSDPGAVAITNRFHTNLLTLPARVGLVRFVTGPVAGLSPDDASAYTAHSVTVRSAEAWIDEGRGMQESLAQARRVTTLGSVPLIVLSRGLPEDGEEQWQREQTELLQLSSASRQVFADQSHHNIQFEQPAAATAAIVQMVEQIRRQSMP
jgi:pimeloyl-ACP methyl ester carboxylesterase